MMTKSQVAYINLLRKKMRTLLTIIGIALSAWVLVSLLGFNRSDEASLNKDGDIFPLVWIETLILCTAGGILGVLLRINHRKTGYKAVGRNRGGSAGASAFLRRCR